MSDSLDRLSQNLPTDDGVIGPDPWDYDPEVDDETRWSRCGAVHPQLPEAVCPMYLFDGKPHQGRHGFLLRWE